MWDQLLALRWAFGWYRENVLNCLQGLSSSSLGGGIHGHSPTIHQMRQDPGLHGLYLRVTNHFGHGYSLCHSSYIVYGRCSTFLLWMYCDTNDYWGILKLWPPTGLVHWPCLSRCVHFVFPVYCSSIGQRAFTKVYQGEALSGNMQGFKKGLQSVADV
jgi:hypothetical protein